ncbi:MAG: thermonuclease family protein [Sciscionella sp.]
MRHGGNGTAAWIVLALVVGLVVGAALTSGGSTSATPSPNPVGAGQASGSSDIGTVTSAGDSGSTTTSGASGSTDASTSVPPGTQAAAATIGTFTGLCSQPTSATQAATVVRVIDGDTIVVDRGQGQEHLRYIGMDTPEIVKPDTPVQPFGPQAAAANHALVSGKTVTLEKDVSEVDQYDRLLRFVWLRDPTQPTGWLMVDRVLLREGLAKVTTFPPDVKCVDAFLADQRYAQARGLGFWSDGTDLGASASAPVGLIGPRSTASATPKSSAKPQGSAAFYRPPDWDGISDVDCSDFKTNAQAQSFFVGTGGSRTNDPYRLDSDHDGQACESLP